MKKQFALMVVALLLILYGLSLTKSNSIAVNSPNTEKITNPEESAITSAVKSNLPSVVTISSKTDNTSNNIGSGFIVSSDGLILTNKHVVSDVSGNYSVITNNNETFDVKKIYKDPLNDLAILKIDAAGLKPVVLGDSSSLQLGQTAIAIGTPLGEFRNTVTSGVISGVSRGIKAGTPFLGSVEQLNNVIQTDAPISPGNSGGPLLDSNGNVIGINTAVSVSGSNLGFAIPVNVAKDLINAFQNNGQNFQQPFLGVRYVALDSSQASSMGSVPGAYVVEVLPNSPANMAGIKANDIITKFAGQSVSSDGTNELSSLILLQKVGNKVPIEIWRNNKTMIVQVVLQSAK